MKILITGASGFIGSFIVEEALSRGFETWAGVRTSSSREYLQDNRIHFLDLDFSSEDNLFEAFCLHEQFKRFWCYQRKTALFGD